MKKTVTINKTNYPEISPYSSKLPIKIYGFEYRSVFSLYNALKTTDPRVQYQINRYDYPELVITRDPLDPKKILSKHYVYSNLGAIKHLMEQEKVVGSFRKDWFNIKDDVLFYILRLKLGWHTDWFNSIFGNFKEQKVTHLIYDGPKLTNYEVALNKLYQYWLTQTEKKEVESFKYIWEPHDFKLYHIRNQSMKMEVLAEFWIKEEGNLDKELTRQIRQARKMEQKLEEAATERRMLALMDSIVEKLTLSDAHQELLIRNIESDYNQNIIESDKVHTKWPTTKSDFIRDQTVEYFKEYMSKVDMDQTEKELQDAGTIIYQLASCL